MYSPINPCLINIKMSLGKLKLHIKIIMCVSMMSKVVDILFILIFTKLLFHSRTIYKTYCVLRHKSSFQFNPERCIKTEKSKWSEVADLGYLQLNLCFSSLRYTINEKSV